MDNLEVILHLLYKRVPAQQVISGKLKYNSFDKEEFLRLVSSYIFYYSENEASNLLNYYTDIFRENARTEGRWISDDLNVFEALFYCANQFLVIRHNEVVCRYPLLLEWRKVTLELGEDIVVAAFLARSFSYKEAVNGGFLWKRVIGHNNLQLEAIIKKGLSENHFHLNGSAPIFQISWISLMNNISNSKFSRNLAEYDKDRRYANVAYTSGYQELPFYYRAVQAALIRLLLYGRLTGRHFKFGEYYEDVKNIHPYLRRQVFCYREEMDILYFTTEMEAAIDEYMSKIPRKVHAFGDVIHKVSRIMLVNEKAYNDFWRDNCGQERMLKGGLGRYQLTNGQIEKCLKACAGLDISGVYLRLLEEIPRVELEEVRGLFCDLNFFYQMWDQRTLENVQSALIYPYEELQFQIDQLQSVIDSFRLSDVSQPTWEYPMDYALEGLYTDMQKEEYVNSVVSGERWLMYMMFRKLYRKEGVRSEYYNLFYAYLLIKESIRSELVQSNCNVGFRNFQRYEQRKGDFLADSIYRSAFIRSAVSESLLTKGLKRLEVRMSPWDNVEKNYQMIQETDALLDPENCKKDRFFYTLHFIKGVDDTEDSMVGYYCRHKNRRQLIQEQARAIVGLREKYPYVGRRILGIDAAANEIGCRPEVFAVAFRYLQAHRGDYMTINGIYKLPQLRATYHVGEDFLDLADGLRAIEEAIQFLGLESGDRLGHALALGVNVREWYSSKNYRIALPLQDYLDNIVWIYHKLLQFNIEGFEILKDRILGEFVQLFYELYTSNVTSGELRCIAERSGRNETGLSQDGRTDIFNYYYAWQLRGDDPELYEFGFFDESKYLQRIQEFRVNENFPENYSIRYSSEAPLIYYLYHYNRNVREKGRRTKETIVSKMYARAVAEIQRAIQAEIAHRGIAIETNPSSNYMIGTFRKYEKHPIIQFYNKDLVRERDEMQECSQISVSVNTDDQGVFNTSLENEYALLACALEFVTDENDRPVYDKVDIYKWLDQIRIMGNEQSFGYIADMKGDEVYY